MKQINLRYYAQLREERGCEEEAVQSDAATALDLYEELRIRHAFSLDRAQLKVAVNDEFRDWPTEIHDGDRVVFIPPVAGGAGGFRLTDGSIDCAAESRRLRRPDAGALATFEGWVRDHNEGRDVTRLEYEAYPEMAAREGDRILAEARARYDILDAACVHYNGPLEISGIAVWIGVVSVHRTPAFNACQYIIDNVKVRVPIWKQEHYTNGDSGWVACHDCAATVSA